MSLRVDPDILVILGRAKTNGHALRIEERLGRRTYDAVARVLERLGGTWDRKANAHLFGEVLAEDALEQVLLTGLVTDERQELGAFYTPPALALQVIACAEIAPGMETLEPSAGRGALAALALAAGARVDCIEIDPKAICVLDKGDYRRVMQADFLNEWPKPVYDRVVMNPPFARQHDLSHVRHALRFLRPGGRLVAIMSAGLTFRQTARTVAMRRLVEAGAGDVLPLPDGSFQSAGTAVRTVLVTIEATAALIRNLKEPRHDA